MVGPFHAQIYYKITIQESDGSGAYQFIIHTIKAFSLIRSHSHTFFFNCLALHNNYVNTQLLSQQFMLSLIILIEMMSTTLKNVGATLIAMFCDIKFRIRAK